MNARKRGLGRGLNALFEDSETDLQNDNTPFGANVSHETNVVAQPAAGAPRGQTTLLTGQLAPSRFQPRTVFSDENLEELASSIKAHGLLQPIIVRKDKDSADQYEIIAGERRWRAAQKAQLHNVPVIVKELTDLEALEIALIENLQREDLNAVDEATGYKRLLEEHDYTQEDLAKQLGKSRSYIANMVRLLSLPTIVLGHLERGDLSIGHARALITSKNAEDLAREVIKNKLSVRETERLASGRPEIEEADMTSESFTAGKDLNVSSGTRSAPNSKSADLLDLEKRTTDTLGMRVSINHNDKSQKGRLVIEYGSLDQLDTVLEKLAS